MAGNVPRTPQINTRFCHQTNGWIWSNFSGKISSIWWYECKLVAVIPFSHLPTSKIKPPWKLLCIGAVTARQQLRLVKRNTNEPDGFISLHQKDNGCSEDLFPRLWRVYYWADRDKHSHPHSHTLTAVDLLWTTSRCMSSSLSSSLKPGANPESYKDQSKHTQRLFQPSSAETRLKNPAREPIVACFCAKTNIWQIQTEEQSAAKSPKRCKDVGDIFDVDVWATCLV